MRIWLLTFIILIFSGCSSEQNSAANSPTPTNESIIKPLFTSACVDVDRVVYPRQKDTTSYFYDTKDMVVFWDDRYSDSLSSISCTPNLNGSTIVDTRTTTENITFGGSQSTLIYRLGKTALPFKDGNALMMQIAFDKMEYENLGGNTGGNIVFNLFLINKVTDERINYIITVYAMGRAWDTEQDRLLYDPTTDTHFISTTVDVNNKYSTISPFSNIVNTDNGFFRTNITQENIQRVLGMGDFKNIDLSQWYVSFIGIQFELEESRGAGILSGEFNSFEAYIATGAM